MRSTWLVLAVVPLLFGCATQAAEEGGGEDVRVVARGLNFEPYEGIFAGYRPLDEALDAMEPSTEEALRRMEQRLGLVPDPERPRLVRVDDLAESWYAESRIIGSREVQVIVLPAAPLAQGRVSLSEILLEALTAAVLEDRRYAGIPDWFRGGAPRWISGRTERVLVERILGQDVVPVSDEVVLPGFDPFRGPADHLSGSFFLGYLAETFGAEVLPELVRTLASAETTEAGLAAVLPHDPASLEAGFDTYRVLHVSKLAEDPYVVEILTVRGLEPAERVVRLSGLSSRAPHPVVGVAAAEDLGLAQFENGDYAGAAATLARVERDHLRDALHPDRDRFLFALSFSRREQDSAAALRFTSFLLEFPTSSYAPRALFELAGVTLDSGRTPDAMARFVELNERYPGTPYAQKGLLVLAAWEIEQCRYALARRHIMAALLHEGAEAALKLLDESTADGLPEDAAPVLREALTQMGSQDSELRRVGIRTLVEIGPLAGAELTVALSRDSGDVFPTAAIEVVSAWDLESATPPLRVLLASENPERVEAALSALAGLGATPPETRLILDGLPARSRVAEEVWITRYGGESGVPEVAGLIDDPAFERRVDAALVLATVRRPEAVRALATLLEDDSPAVRRAAASALSRHSGSEVAKALATALADESVGVRLAAIESHARLGLLDPLRNPGLSDPKGAVRLAAAARLLQAGEDQDYARVVALLAAPEAGVAVGAEHLLREREGPAYEGALVAALISADEAGPAMRIVRLMCRRVGQDLGYDPGAGDEERERVARLFTALIDKS